MDNALQQLLAPQAYPEEPGPVEFKETHISRIYLTRNHVYKVKKNLNLGFLDFSSLENRRYFCQEELRLNRRFTSGLYCDVVELRSAGGRLNFCGEGELIDYAVRMRRLPEERMLNRMIEREATELHDEMLRLAHHLDWMFCRAEVRRDPKLQNAVIVATNSRDNFSQTRSFPESLLCPSAHRVMAAICEQDLARLQETFRQREADGMVRDGHGDLHTGNVCMTDPIQVYDCIEFNDQFRIADVAADLAFLLMDLDFLGRRGLSDQLLADYLAISEDRNLDLVLPFYKRYRAWVRGKVNGILATETDVDKKLRRQSGELARGYFNLAMGYALKPTLMLTCGLMGSGKSTLAKRLAASTGATLLRSDVVRKELAGVTSSQPVLSAYQSGIYSLEMTEQTYRELAVRTEAILTAGKPVVVDAAFGDSVLRRQFTELGAGLGQQAWLLHVHCPDHITLQRLDQRENDVSDGRPELFHAQKKGFSPPASAENVISIDSLREVDYNVQQILKTVLVTQEGIR
ncbi:MAG: kinase [Desulfuromonas sp.]|nr:MAG: kinase [Desulfuromonas sp.]